MKLRVLTLLMLCTAVAICMLSSVVLGADIPPASLAGPPPAPAVTTVSAPDPVSAPVTISDPNYRILPDDIIRLDVWGEPTLTGAQLSVTPNGTVSMPYLGEMKIDGMTQTEVANLVSKKLQEAEILADAKVQITLVSMHRLKARVLGAVQRPCEFDFKNGDTIYDAIAQGGSYSEDAMLEKATLTHKDSDKPVEINLRKLFAGDLTQNYKLQDGDALYLPHEDYHNKFYVFGQVNRPGQYSLKEKTDVLTAISLAGGQLPRASVRSTMVVRYNNGKPEKVKANLSRLFDKGDLSQDIALQAGDIVIVPETRTPDLGKIGQVLSTIVNVGYLGRLF